MIDERIAWRIVRSKELAKRKRKRRPENQRAARKRDGIVCRAGCSSIFATPYRYVCTTCHKMWRHAGSLPCCPECRGPVVHVGKDTRVPRARNSRAWARLAKKFASTRPDYSG